VTITQSVAIVAPPGVYAGVSVSTGDGIVVNAGASDVIILRGLTVNSQGTSGSGIVFNFGGELHVENCIVNGFSPHGDGLFFNGGNGTKGFLEVKDSTFRGNDIGINVDGPAVAVIDRVRVEGNNTDGISVLIGAQVTVRNSVFSANGIAMLALASSFGSAELNIERCVVSNNAIGVRSTSDFNFVSTVRISNSTVTDNSIGLQNIGALAVFLSRLNNTVRGNGSDTSGTIGSYTAK